jgi:hypothetical protein
MTSLAREKQKALLLNYLKGMGVPLGWRANFGHYPKSTFERLGLGNFSIFRGQYLTSELNSNQ